MNKSLVTNVASVALVGVGYAVDSALVRTMGLFATSGALTNWLAVHMLFEKVPLLYGSGVIPARFEEFKEAIRELIMAQFFTKENVERFFREARAAAKLEHPNVVAVQDVGTTDSGLNFIIMQYVDGKNLEETIQSKGKHQPVDAEETRLASHPR